MCLKSGNTQCDPTMVIASTFRINLVDVRLIKIPSRSVHEVYSGEKASQNKYSIGYDPEE